MENEYLIQDYDLDVETIKERLDGYNFGYISRQVDGLHDWPLPNCKKYTKKFPDGNAECACLVNMYKARNGIEPGEGDELIKEAHVLLFVRGKKYLKYYICYKGEKDGE